MFPALTNLGAGAFATRLGRRRLLIAGWAIALPVPLLIAVAPSWEWIVAANVLLGINQGLRKPLIVAGMLLQAAALGLLALSDGAVALAGGAAVALGFGTALVYPTLIAAISDAVSPIARASMVGVYRFWRDMGYVAGALIAGVVSDALGFGGAIVVVAALTGASGLWVAIDMPPSATSHAARVEATAP